MPGRLSLLRPPEAAADPAPAALSDAAFEDLDLADLVRALARRVGELELFVGAARGPRRAR
jgi:hypothetical protein